MKANTHIKGNTKIHKLKEMQKYKNERYTNSQIDQIIFQLPRYPCQLTDDTLEFKVCRQK